MEPPPEGEEGRLSQEARELLVELSLEEFELAFCGLRVESVNDLTSMRYEELLEMGLSKVQCHLFFAKVSALAQDSLASADLSGMSPLDGMEGEDLRGAMDAQDAKMASASCGSSCDPDGAGAGPGSGAAATAAWDVRSPGQAQQGGAVARRKPVRLASRMMMPPPSATQLASPGLDPQRSLKRPLSCHLSTRGARGSERATCTSVSARSDVSSCSFVDSVRRAKRRRLGPAGVGLPVAAERWVPLPPPVVGAEQDQW